MTVALGILCGLAQLSAQWSLGDDTVRRSRATIVVFYTYRDFVPVNADWDRGIRRGLASQWADGIHLEVEYLDLNRFSDEGYRQQLVELLEHKYSEKNVSAVIPVYTQAIQFVLANRQSLFPRAPIVFCSSPVELVRDFMAAADVTGTSFKFDFVRTIEEAKRLLPETRRLYLIGGASPTDRNLRKLAREALTGAAEDLEIVDVEGPTVSELKRTMANAGPDSIALMLTYDRDNHENELITCEVLAQLSADCTTPIFGLYDTLLGLGIVGGCLVPVEDQGYLAGQMAGRVMKGEAPSAIPVAGSDGNRFMFDARQLRRFGIADRNLAPGSVVRYANDSFWDRYRLQILSGFGLLIFQAVIIGALAFNRSRRIFAERSMLASREDARQLAGRLLSAQEDERRRLAREMHDDLSQRLAASAIEAANLERRLADSADCRQAVGQLKEDLIAISDDVHRLAYQLHPAILDDLGVVEAIRSECDRLSSRQKINIQFRCGTQPKGLPRETGLCLYRTAQEALWNAVRHAATDSVNVFLGMDPEGVHLEIRDSGKGFDATNISGNGGLGLASIKERARLVGGRLTIDSCCGTGTRVTLNVPFSTEPS